MRQKITVFMAAIAALVLVTGTAFGYAPVEAGQWLTVDVGWIDGFTAHLDRLGGGAALASAAAGAVKEQVEAAVKELRENIENATKDQREKLKANLQEQLGELEERIKKGEEAGEAVAEIKEKSAKMSEDNAKFVDEIQEIVKKYADETNERIEKLEKKAPSDPESGGMVNFGALAAKAAKEKGLNSNTEKQLAIYRVEKSFIPRNRKDITAADTDVYPRQGVPGIIGPGERQLRVRNLLPVNRTSERTVYFVSETALTDNAGMQTEGAAKAETTFNVQSASESVRTVAHFIQVPLQMLDDLVALEDYINSRMIYMLLNKEEQQILYGNNTGQELNGLFTQATAFDTTLLTELGVSSPTDIDRIRAAIAQVQVAEYAPDGILMHPYNWANIEMTKDSQNRYIWAMPQDSGVPRLWGLPVVATTQVASPDFLVGSFQIGAALWDRQESSIAISTEDSDNFQKNLATIRAEERVALTVYRTASFVEGDFANTVT